MTRDRSTADSGILLPWKVPSIAREYALVEEEETLVNVWSSSDPIVAHEGGDVMKLKQIMYEHPAWIICSPEYNGSYTALLKNTIDWASRPVASDPAWTDGYKPFTGKVVGVLSASPGALGGLRSQSHLVPLLLNLHCWVCPQNYALGRAADAFDADGALTNPAHTKNVQAVIDQVLWAGSRLAGGAL